MWYGKIAFTRSQDRATVETDLSGHRGFAKSGRRLPINWATDLPHHRAYRSVHGSSLVYTNFQVVVSHGHKATADYFFLGQNSVQHKR